MLSAGIVNIASATDVALAPDAMDCTAARTACVSSFRSMFLLLLWNSAKICNQVIDFLVDFSATVFAHLHHVFHVV